MAHMSIQNGSDNYSFIVEGNIGAGKSTFLKLIEKHLPVTMILEPHEKWQNVGGTQNLLAAFYNDAPRWAYTFQTFAFITRVIAHQDTIKNSPHSTHILERSVYSDRYCFAKNSYEMGLMNELEWQLYQEWFAWLTNQYIAKPAGFIYLRTDPEVCHARLLKRGRHEEATVSKDYLIKLHQKHEDWLIHKIGIADALHDVPVLSLPCDNEFETDLAEQERHILAVSDFIKTTCAGRIQQKEAQMTL